MTPESWHLDNGQGWEVHVRRHTPVDRVDPTLRPLVMVPGYAMNSFILGFHPQGRSMIAHLADRGIEVWTVDMRGQGGAERRGGSRRYGLGELALVDLPLALDHVRATTATRHAELDLVGCSLGASVAYAYLAHHPDDHGVGAMVSIGGPLRWDAVHPAMRLVFASARVAGAVPIVGTRRMARAVLPIVQRVPALLSIYMNADQVELSAADQLVKTVDDPVPHINRQLARWLRRGDLVVRGLNITEGLRGVDVPVLCILANADGIVPPAAALSVAEVLDEVTVLEVGDDRIWFAHADLFISETAEPQVFQPMGDWLLGHAPGADAPR